MVNAAVRELECKVKHNVTYGPQEERISTCELHNVKYNVGRPFKFSSNISVLAYHKLRVKFVQSSVQVFPGILFDEFRKLEILEMNEVGMRSILQQSFNGADSLRILQAYGNKISLLGGFIFVGASKLQALDLSSNQISNINYETFVGLDSLKELSLSSNRISILDEQTFHPLSNLEWLWLDRNELKIIAVNLLVNCQKIQGMYLNHNKISALSTILFDQMDELKFLFLSNNNCTSHNFVNTKIAKNANVKKELSKCFKEFRTIVPEEEEKFRLRNVLRDAEKANAQCESDKAALLERLEASKKQLQGKNGK